MAPIVGETALEPVERVELQILARRVLQVGAARLRPDHEQRAPGQELPAEHQVAAQGGGNAALYTGAQMGNAASDKALTSAYGGMAGTNAWADAANQIAQLPWDKINWGGGGGGGGAGGLPNGEGFN